MLLTGEKTRLQTYGLFMCNAVMIFAVCHFEIIVQQKDKEKVLLLKFVPEKHLAVVNVHRFDNCLAYHYPIYKDNSTCLH